MQPHGKCYKEWVEVEKGCNLVPRVFSLGTRLEGV